MDYNSLVTEYDKRIDKNNILYRVNDMLFKYFVNNTYIFIQKLVYYMYVETSVPIQIIRLQGLSNSLALYNAYPTLIELNRKLSLLLPTYHVQKGTLLCLRSQLNLIGLDLNLVTLAARHWDNILLDTDAPDITFDSSSCGGCVMYSIYLFDTWNNANILILVESIKAIIAFNNPANGKLISVLYNGNDISNYIL